MEPSAQLVVFAGLAMGLVYGAVGLLSGFCLMSSLRGWLGEGDGRLVRTYALAVATAIAASQALAAEGLVDLGKSIYLQPTLSVPVLFVGGLLFGYGMVLSNGCGSRALVLLGRGNLRSFVVVTTLAVAAQMTLKGLIAPTRIAVVQASQIRVDINALPSLLARVGAGEVAARIAAAAVIVVALLLFAFAHSAFRRSPGQIAAGLVVGLLVACGWYVTGHVGADDFNPAPVTSLTFVAPIADALQYAMLSTGLSPNFGIATVAGVVGGSLVTALATGRFRLEGYASPRHMLRSMAGAALMGIGGVMAFGCSVGQGLTGMSTLALSSFVALAGILLGTRAGLRGRFRVQPLAAA